MKTIENKITVGAPGSLARYQNAHRICVDCLDKSRYVLGQTQQPCGDWIPATEPYKALSVGGSFASYDGTCYVCEQKAHVAVVEFNAPVDNRRSERLANPMKPQIVYANILGRTMRCEAVKGESILGTCNGISRYPYVSAIAWNGSTPCTYSVKLSPELPLQTVCCDNEQAAIELATQILLVGRPVCECGNTNAGWHGPRNGHRQYMCDKCWQEMRVKPL